MDVPSLAQSKTAWYTYCEGNPTTYVDLTIGATPDENGIYTIKQDYGQSIEIVGYNDLYNVAFDIATSMGVEKFDFEVDGEK